MHIVTKMEKATTKNKEISIPSGVEVSVNGYIVKMKGPKGEITRDLSNPRLVIQKKDNSILVSSPIQKQTKKDKMFINTCVAHINNIIKGVINGYEAKMKICSGHFPMSVAVDNKMFVVKNFLGEKVPRKVDLLEGVIVKVDGDIVKINGCDKEMVGLSASKIEKLCAIRGRDLRTFQDGIWLIEKTREVKNG